MLALILVVLAAILFFLDLIGVPAKFSLTALGGLCVCCSLLIGHIG